MRGLKVLCTLRCLVCFALQGTGLPLHAGHIAERCILCASTEGQGSMHQ